MDGETKQLVKYHIYDQKKTAEQKFQLCTSSDKPEFKNILSDWQKAYDAWRAYSMHRVYINEGVLGSPLIALASTLQQVENALVKQNGGDIKKAITAARDARKIFLESRKNKTSDEKIFLLPLR